MLVMKMETPASESVSASLSSTDAFLSVQCQEFSRTNVSSSPEDYKINDLLQYAFLIQIPIPIRMKTAAKLKFVNSATTQTRKPKLEL